MNDDEWGDAPIESKLDWLREQFQRIVKHLNNGVNSRIVLAEENIKRLENRLSAIEASGKAQTSE